jgi:hypothetical protein
MPGNSANDFSNFIYRASSKTEGGVDVEYFLHLFTIPPARRELKRITESTAHLHTNRDNDLVVPSFALLSTLPKDGEVLLLLR